MEALDADAVRAQMPFPPIGGSAAADRIAEALGTPNPTAYGERLIVTAFVVRRLVDLSVNPDGTLHHPAQVDHVCQREDLANLVAADTPLGPEQAAARLQVRRTDFTDHVVRLGWVRSPQSIEVQFGTSRAGAVDVALYTTASVDAVIPAHSTGNSCARWRKAGVLLSRRCDPLPHPRSPFAGPAPREITGPGAEAFTQPA